jgi:hypothetical protein
MAPPRLAGARQLGRQLITSERATLTGAELAAAQRLVAAVDGQLHLRQAATRRERTVVLS